MTISDEKTRQLVSYYGLPTSDPPLYMLFYCCFIQISLIKSNQNDQMAVWKITPLVFLYAERPMLSQEMCVFRILQSETKRTSQISTACAVTGSAG